MRDFIISVNSTVDAPKEWLDENKIVVVPLKYTIDGVTYVDKEGLTPKEFFNKLREGKQSVTTQVNPEDAKAIFEPILKEGKDILHLGFTSGLSGTLNSMVVAGEELSEAYPEAKIIVIDTLCACLGEAMILFYALKMKNEGKTIDEIAKWVEENKLHVCHNVTVDDLHHLHRGGRISKTTAIVGSLIQIKPIIHVDDAGKLQVIGRSRGRKKSLHKLVDMAAEQSIGWNNDIIMITHGDCIDDANYVASLVRERLGVDNIMINDIGTVIGSHTGPGVLAVFNMGNKR
ncbi:MAG: DegV family protein [Lachnospiraceae bacterium]|jgi:DegV family protein with EDD domain|nr:DegV family protein [Lachnospiraceae bacterium]